MFLLVFAPWVIPLTLVVLVALFVVQSKGTARVGQVFGSIMVVWFVVLGVLGLLRKSCAEPQGATCALTRRMRCAMQPCRAGENVCRNGRGISGFDW